MTPPPSSSSAKELWEALVRCLQHGDVAEAKLACHVISAFALSSEAATTFARPALNVLADIVRSGEPHTEVRTAAACALSLVSYIASRRGHFTQDFITSTMRVLENVSCAALSSVVLDCWSLLTSTLLIEAQLVLVKQETAFWRAALNSGDAETRASAWECITLLYSRHHKEKAVALIEPSTADTLCAWLRGKEDSGHHKVEHAAHYLASIEKGFIPEFDGRTGEVEIVGTGWLNIKVLRVAHRALDPALAQCWLTLQNLTDGGLKMKHLGATDADARLRINLRKPPKKVIRLLELRRLIPETLLLPDDPDQCTAAIKQMLKAGELAKSMLEEDLRRTDPAVIAQAVESVSEYMKRQATTAVPAAPSSPQSASPPSCAERRPQRIHPSIFNLLQQINKRKRGMHGQSVNMFEWLLTRFEKLSELITRHITPQHKQAHSGIPWDHLTDLPRWLIPSDGEYSTFVAGVRTTVRIQPFPYNRERHASVVNEIVRQDVPQLLKSLTLINSNDWFEEKRLIANHVRRLVDFHTDEPQLNVIETSVNTLLMVDKLAANSYKWAVSPYVVLRHVTALGEALHQLSSIVRQQYFDSSQSLVIKIIKLRNLLSHPEREANDSHIVKLLNAAASDTAAEIVILLHDSAYLDVVNRSEWTTQLSAIAVATRRCLQQLYGYKETYEDGPIITPPPCPPVHGEYHASCDWTFSTLHRTRLICPESLQQGSPMLIARWPFDNKLPEGWVFWAGVHTTRVKRLVGLDDRTYCQRTTSTAVTTWNPSAIIDSCGQYRALRLAELLGKNQTKDYTDFVEMIQMYCENLDDFKLWDLLRRDANKARLFVNTARAFCTTKRHPSISSSFQKLVDKDNKRRVTPAVAAAVSTQNRVSATTRSQSNVQLLKGAQQVERMMQYLKSAEDAVHLHKQMMKQIQRDHPDDLMLASAHRADARMIVEPVREWWMIMAGSMATAVLENRALLPLITSEAREILVHLVKAVRNLLAHNRVDATLKDIPASHDVEALITLPQRSGGVALTSALPGESYQVDLYSDIAYHTIVCEAKRKLEVADLASVIREAQSAESGDHRSTFSSVHTSPDSMAQV